jgi:pyruvate dehydrogenase E1 component beta subunit
VEAVRVALADELAADERVIVMGQEVGALGGVFTATSDLEARFGEDRILDTPLAESATVGWAIGAAMEGLRPVVEIMFMDFVTTAMDQVVNGAAKLRYMSGGQVDVPLVIRMPSDAGTHHGPQHSQHLETWFAHVPGLVVAMPSRVNDVYWMLREAIQDDNPVIFVESKYLYFRERGRVDPAGTGIARRYGARLARRGSDLTVVTAGRMVQATLQAVAELADTEGVSCEVIDLRYVWPWDQETVSESLLRTSKLAIVHEAVRDFGWGAEIAAYAAERHLTDLDGPVVRVGAQRAPVPFARPLEDVVVPTVSRIRSALLELARF